MLLMQPPQLDLSIDSTGFYRGQEPFCPCLELGRSLWPVECPLTPDTKTFEESVNRIVDFQKALLPKIKNDLLGVLLYQGAFDFREPLKGEEEANFQDFCRENPQTAYPLELFRGQMLSEYVHRLISFFPEDLPVFLFFDVSSLRPSLAAKLFNSHRFRYVHLGIKDSSIPLGIVTWQQGYPTYGSTDPLKLPARLPPSLGICLPTDALCTLEVFERLDILFSTLNQEGTDYRILPEELLAEEWNGIDELLCLESAVSTKGKRLLSGFVATGGQVSFAT